MLKGKSLLFPFFLESQSMKLTVRIILAFLLAALGISYFSHCFDFELKLYETKLTPYFFSGIVARVLLALYFVTAIFWLLGKFSKFLSLLTLLLLAIPLYFGVWHNIEPQIIEIDAFNYFPSWFPVPILVIGLVATIISFYISSPSTTNAHWLKLVKYTLATGSVVIVFVVNPLFLDEFTDESRIFDSTEIGEVELAEKTTYPQLRAYFSTSCPYCEMASKRLKLLEKNYRGFPEVKLYFLGDEERVQWFFDDTHTQFDYEIMETGRFLRITGGSFPQFIYMNQSQAKLMYSGRTFNYGSPKTILAN